MINILCVCQHGFSRSPTIRQIVSKDHNVKSYACGVDLHAIVPVSQNLVNWADIIICAEEHHGKYLQEEFSKEVEGKSIIALNIPDEYDYMEGELVQLIHERLAMLEYEKAEIQ